MFPEIVEALRSRFDVEHNDDDRPWPTEELARRAADKQGVLATVMDRIDESVLAAAPGLKVVSNIAVGTNNIDIPACTKRGIRVTNTPGRARRHHRGPHLGAAHGRRAPHRGRRRAGAPRRLEARLRDAVPLGTDVHHATLGIIGMGRIGQAIAKRATGFDMRVLYHNRGRIPEADEKRLGATWVERDRLLAESDFVVVMVPYSPAVHHLIGAAEIARMKPTAILVNTARGGVVDDAALVEALKAKRIAGAGLDVFEGEPKLNPGYLALPNAVLTPHIGSATRATRLKMCETAVANLTAVLEGRAPPNLVNRELA